MKKAAIKRGGLLLSANIKEWKWVNQPQKFGEHGSWEWNLSENKLTWSDELYHIYHTTPSDFSHQIEDILKLVHSDDIEKVQHAHSLAINKYEHYEIKYRINRKDGTKGILLEYGEPIFNEENNQIISIVGVTQDITYTIKSELSLLKSQLNLTQAQRIFGFVNWEFDIESRKLEWSDGALELLGIIPNTIYDFEKLIHPNDMEFVSKSGNEAIKGKPYNIEYRIIRPDGIEKTIHEQAQVIYSLSGKPDRMLGTILDVTERKKTEEFLLNSDKLSLVGQLAAGIAHEIRNPLTALKGFIQLIELGDSKKEYFSIIKDEITRIDFIVSEFLSISKPQSVIFENKNIIQILKQVTSFLSSHFNLKNIELRANYPFEKIFVYCAENQLKQLFVNIIKNAIEAMNNGGILIIEAEIKQNKLVHFRFIDNGIGIPQESIKRLGEPFYSTKDKGTGLGLMVCQKIIKDHAGQLLIESTLGAGTIVSVILPIKDIKTKAAKNLL